MNRIFLSVVLLAATLTAKAQPGTLDPNFGAGGKVEGNFGQYIASRAYAVAIQPDGKILVAGQYDKFGPTAPFKDFLVARYNTDGSLDNTFDGDGVATVDFNGGDDVAYAMALQPDGKILLAGTTITSSDRYPRMVRLNSNGSIDMTFGINGMTGSNQPGEYKAISLHADGRIAVCGSTQSDAAFAHRYSASGVQDGSFMPGTGIGFNTGGIYPNIKNAANAVGALPDGRVLVAGYVVNSNNDTKFGFEMVKADGSYIDWGFTDNSYSNVDRFHAMIFQPDGKILAAGMAATKSVSADLVLMRFQTNSRRDSSFGNAGVARAMMTSSYNVINAIALQNDGRVVVAGAAPGSAGIDFAVLRFNPYGSVDNSFDDDGIALISNTSGDDVAQGVAVQQDGKIVVVGNALSQPNYTLVRLLGGDGVHVDEVANSNGLKVYPNPGNGVFVVEAAKGGVAYTVTDVKGSVVATGTTAHGQTKIDLTKNANGIYLLQIENETVKLVKE